MGRWGCGVVGKLGLLGVVVLRLRVVGTGCCLWSKLLPVPAMRSRKIYAGPASFHPNHPSKPVDQAEGHALICGSTYEPGLISRLPEIVGRAVGLGFAWSDFGFL